MAKLSSIGRSNTVCTLLEVLQQRVEDYAEACAFRYLRENGRDTSITYGQLDKKARQIAVEIQRRIQPGDRALLVFPAGWEFISAFFGCLYAGVVAVPATYPNSKRGMPRVSAIADDCDAAVALTLSRSLTAIDLDRASERLRTLTWIAVDAIGEDAEADCVGPEVTGDTLAFLQYTSGSTSVPKGVMVSHGNVIYNLEMIRVGFGIPPRCSGEPAGIGVSWLPAYHDMGLIGGILESLYVGGCTVLMSPASFLQRPERWLHAISDYGASVSGAPNFAYDLCVRRASEKRLGKLDLSSWRVAYCGAEPIRAGALERFAKTFAPSGFRKEAFYPCYGLAEATLLAAGGREPAQYTVCRVMRSQLRENRVINTNGRAQGDVATLVGCGDGLLAQEIAVVDAHSLSRCRPGRVGEIWIRGPNVAQGYWGRPQESQETFAARLSDTGEQPFLRTGDLGFVQDGNLYITGRAKDVIIVRGRNYYPQDIELTAETAHDALLPNSGAAFSVEHEGEQQLVVIQEVDRACQYADFEEIAGKVRAKIVAHHELDPHVIVLIRQASLPRTTSGKVQRSLCRQRYLEDELKVVAQWTRPTRSSKPLPSVPDDPEPARADAKSDDWHREGPNHLEKHQAVDRLAERIEGLLVKWLCEQGVAPADIDRHKVFADYGVDSLAAVELSGDLEEWLGIEISPVIAWQFPTSASLARYLASQAGHAKSDDEPEGASSGGSGDGDLATGTGRIEGLTECQARGTQEHEAFGD